MGLLKNIFLNNPLKKKLRNYIEFLSVSRDEDIGMMLALGTVARRLMVVEYDSLKYLLGGENEIDYSSGNENIYQSNLDLIHMSNVFQKEIKNNSFFEILLGGVAVWKLTVTCLPGKDDVLDQEFYTLGRLMWKELDRGFPYVESSLIELETKITGIDKWHYENCYFSPKMFKV